MPAMKEAVSNVAAFGCGKYTTWCGTPLMVKFHRCNWPIMMGESNSNSTELAANVFGSSVGASPDAIAQPFGRSTVRRAGTDSAPTTYISECRSPTSPPAGERNGFHAARVGVVCAGG